MQTKDLAKYGKYIALGSQIAASMIIPVVLGIYLGRYWNFDPWGVIIGTLLGFGGLISIVLKLASQTGKSEYQKKKNNSRDDKI